MFKGLDTDGAELYDTKEEAITRARMMQQWNDPDARILVQKNVPLWFALLVKGTWFESLAYQEIFGN